MPADTGLVALFEDIIDAVVADIVASVNDYMAALGPRPFGHTDADPEEQLAYFLSVRDDPAFWGNWIAAQTPAIGLDTAVDICIREQTRYNLRLAELGRWTGDEADLQRAIDDGARTTTATTLLLEERGLTRALDKADTILRLPPITVLPPAAIVTDVQLATGVS